MALRGSMLLAVLMLAGCDRPGDEPLDGGRPLGEPVASLSLDGIANRACFRAERGRWHYSAGHCEAMLPAARIEGVWVTAFEESSFFEGRRTVPDAADPQRYLHEIEMDEREAARLSGHAPSDPDGEAYLLTFEGRRTREPWFDCNGVPSFTFVVDRLAGARHLGPMGPTDRKAVPARYAAYAKQVSGRLGKPQAEAIERCGAGRSDRAGEADQSPAHSSSKGRSSAE
jgi:hypothetical protein